MRVGRGIAAGKGKTAGRGTKGQKARAGGSIPPWFEGGQTPLHMRIPKLRGFKNRFDVEYEIVNLGDIARLLEEGRFQGGDMPGSGSKSKTPAPITVNAEILKDVGLVRSVRKPLKVLAGGGDLSTPLFVVADAFSKSAVSKIEAAGGSVSVLEVPKTRRPAIGVGEDGEAAPSREPRSKPKRDDARASAGADVGERPNRDGGKRDAATSDAGPTPRTHAARPEVESADQAEAVAEAEAASEVASDDAPAPVDTAGDLATPTAVADLVGDDPSAAIDADEAGSTSTAS